MLWAPSGRPWTKGRNRYECPIVGPAKADSYTEQKYKDAYAVHKEQYDKDYSAMFTRGKRSPPTTPIAGITE